MNIFAIFLILMSVMSCVAIKKVDNPYKTWVYQLQNASPVELASLGADVVVIDYSYDGSESSRYSFDQIKAIKESRSIVLSYINIGQAEDYRFYWKESWSESPPGWIIGEDPEWKGDYYIKYWRQGWKNIIFSYIDKILEEGFDGIYLDRIDAFEYVAKEGILSEAKAAEKMINFIEEISNYIKGKKENALVVLQNGERILEYDQGELLQHIDGWAVEDLFYSYEDFSLKPKKAIEEREKYLKIAQNAGKFVLVVEYIDDGKESKETEDRIKKFIDLCKTMDYTPYVSYSDRELNKIDYRFFHIYSTVEPEK